MSRVTAIRHVCIGPESDRHFYLQVAVTVAAVAQPVGTVYDRFGSLSHTTVPSDSFLMNLYSKVVPAGSVTVVVHRGLEEVYEEAESAIAEEVSHELSWLIDPVRKIFSPYVVVTSSLKVTATLVAAVQVAEVVVLEVFVVVLLVLLVVLLVLLLEDDDELEEPEPDPPVMAISAHPR